MDFKKKIIITFFTIFCMGVIWVPVSSATDWASAARWAADTAGKAAAQAALRQLQNRVLSKIRTGGIGGKPLFIQNWADFILKSQYTGENIFRAELSTAKLCDYLANDVKKAFGVKLTDNTKLTGQNTRTDSLQTFGLATTCTMPAGWTPQKYQQDFAGNGGWDAFARMLEPQNNAWGLAALSQDEIQKQRALSEKSNVNEAVSGKGFIGTRGDCKVNGPAGTCLVSGDIKTPGSIFDQTTAAALNAPIQFLANADAATIAISALVGMAVDNIFNIADSKDSSENVKLETEGSYKQEFCSAKKVSGEAAKFVATTIPKAFAAFPPANGLSGGTGACERVRSNDNSFPYTRCVQACDKAVGLIPDSVSVPSSPPIPPGDSGGGLTCTDVPTAKACTMPNHQGLVENVKNYLIAKGQQFNSYCDAFEIVKRVAWALRNEGAGLMTTFHTTQCGGFSADVIAYPDGSGVDILGCAGGPTPDCTNNAPSWQPGPDNPEAGVDYAPATDPGDPAGSY